MSFPRPGDSLGGFTVEEVDVGHVGSGAGRYRYPIRLVIRGKGGKQAARAAVRELFARKRTAFSGYGNPYQFVIGGCEAVRIDDQLYEVTATGYGARIHLDYELRRFYRFLASSGSLSRSAAQSGIDPILESYLNEYQAETTRKNPKTDWFG